MDLIVDESELTDITFGYVHSCIDKNMKLGRWSKIIDVEEETRDNVDYYLIEIEEIGSDSSSNLNSEKTIIIPKICFTNESDIHHLNVVMWIKWISYSRQYEMLFAEEVIEDFQEPKCYTQHFYVDSDYTPDNVVEK